MGMLADRYTDNKERGNAMGIALGGLALGVLIGPPFGGFLFQFFGKAVPFLILALLALLDGCLQMLILVPEVTKYDEEAPTLSDLACDPYIQVCAGAITFANMGIAMLEPSLPLHMMDRMGSESLELGAAFLPASVSYLIGTNLFGSLGHTMGRWRAAQIGLAIIGTCMISVPFATDPKQLIIPMAGIGFAIGMVDSSMMPELGNLVDADKLKVHIEELDSITSLMTVLRVRLKSNQNKAEVTRDPKEKENLSSKISKLLSQLEEADNLKTFRDRRGELIFTALSSYVDEGERRETSH